MSRLVFHQGLQPALASRGDDEGRNRCMLCIEALDSSIEFLSMRPPFHFPMLNFLSSSPAIFPTTSVRVLLAKSLIRREVLWRLKLRGVRRRPNHITELGESPQQRTCFAAATFFGFPRHPPTYFGPPPRVGFSPQCVL